MKQKRQLLPIMDWGRSYDRDKLVADLLASLIVMIMLIPQSLAYALVAGLPPEMGLYASILPLMIYTFFGSSRVLSVGPVAVLSLMTAATLGGLQLAGNAEYIVAALTLAFLSGAFLLILGLLRMGFLANFMSHPVVTGFITASGVIIVLSQVQHLLGISSHGYTLLELLPSLFASLSQINVSTAILGGVTLLWLFWSRMGMPGMLRSFGVSDTKALLLTRMSPVLAVIVTSTVVWYFDLQSSGVATVGQVPSGLPPLTMPSFSLELWQSLAGSAALLATIGFVESVSVAQGLAARRRERIDPDQELIGLGASNLAASFSGGFPVAGGFSRSVVNFDAGAATPAAGFFAAILIAVVTLLFVPWLAWL
ncbi:MAG: SulP family inorganic anion transporter, partial [Pseudohongiellaceae bacterium]